MLYPQLLFTWRCCVAVELFAMWYGYVALVSSRQLCLISENSIMPTVGIKGDVAKYVLLAGKGEQRSIEHLIYIPAGYRNL